MGAQANNIKAGIAAAEAAGSCLPDQSPLTCSFDKG